MMTYRRSDSLHIVGYLDSDYAEDDRKSTSEYVFTLAGGAISWKSSKQTVTTSSTMYDGLQRVMRQWAGELTKEVHTMFEGG